MTEIEFTCWRRLLFFFSEIALALEELELIVELDGLHERAGAGIVEHGQGER